MKLVRTLADRNFFNTDYKVYCIQFTLPIFGRKLNDWLFERGLSNTKYCYNCNKVSYVMRWYREKHKWMK